MLMYQAGRCSRVHFDPECPYRLKGHPGVVLHPVELSSLSNPRFCKRCCPPELSDRPRTLHRICSVCRWRRPFPCKHNGGVPVVHVLLTPGSSRRVRVYYRWPENVLGAPRPAPLADSLSQV